MIQCRCGLSFSLKTGQGLRVAGNFIGQELESDKTVKPCVLGLVNHAHPSAAEFLDDPVMRDGLADHEFSPSMKKTGSECDHIRDEDTARQCAALAKAFRIFAAFGRRLGPAAQS